MTEPSRIDVFEAREKTLAGDAQLVCAYEDDKRFREVMLEGALSFPEFTRRLAAAPGDAEIIFYCA